MSFAQRQASIAGSQHMRQASIGLHGASQSSALQNRINAKRQELESLTQLKDLSGVLAGQMQALEERLSTLKDGTESVACVLANWENVLRAISMASMKVPIPTETQGDGEKEQGRVGEDGLPLPVTLVRIPAGEQGKKSKSGRGGGHE